MWKPRQIVSPPMLPERVRIYAVGDVHGRADLLRQLFSRIDRDLKAHPAKEAIHVFLGDYIDRGKDSAGVLDLLIDRSEAHQVYCLKGNHEIFLTEFLENPGILQPWAKYGALPTLASYGLKPTINASSKEQEELSGSLRNAMP
jgi:serine/threonine protein phosphatase 1